MLGAFFETCRDGKERFFIGACRRKIGYGGRSIRDRAGFVEQDIFRTAERFQCLAGFDQHAEGRASAGSDRDGDGRRESERTRAGDDENGYRAADRMLGAVAENEPNRQRD